MSTAARCLLAACCAALLACTTEPKIERHSFFALGTLVEISVYAPPANLDAVLHAVERDLLDAEHRWRAWDDGELAALNRRLANGEPVEFDTSTTSALLRARDISERSGGRFNPAIGRQVEAWGFHQEERGDVPAPDIAVLDTLLPPPALSDLQRDESGRWQSANPQLWIDFGAFAKGLAVDLAINTLKRHGIENAIVNAGGDLKVIGRPGSRPWRIGVRHPRDAGVLAAIEAADGESIFTSGDYERFFEYKGRRYHHILDPATAQPARGVMSVTVVHPDAALADAAATALFVAGEPHWHDVARNLNIDAVMLVLEDGRVLITRSLQRRLQFETDVSSVQVVGP